MGDQGIEFPEYFFLNNFDITDNRRVKFISRNRKLYILNVGSLTCRFTSFKIMVIKACKCYESYPVERTKYSLLEIQNVLLHARIVRR